MSRKCFVLVASFLFLAFLPISIKSQEISLQLSINSEILTKDEIQTIENAVQKELTTVSQDQKMFSEGNFNIDVKAQEETTFIKSIFSGKKLTKEGNSIDVNISRSLSTHFQDPEDIIIIINKNIKQTLAQIQSQESNNSFKEMFSGFNEIFKEHLQENTRKINPKNPNKQIPSRELKGPNNGMWI
ncbi:MAG TPA: hypothetical protein V6C96_04925 [Vampirovibrionales bacterium]